LLARALEEMSFLALLSGYIAAYWFATNQAGGTLATQAAIDFRSPLSLQGRG
jgi:hypothetical protein